MIQAARSGKQNIAEGSLASGTSKETEIKLTNFAAASLEELANRLPNLPENEKFATLGSQFKRGSVSPQTRLTRGL